MFEIVAEDEFSMEHEQTLLHPSELELGETVRGVIAQVEAVNPQRVVLDSLSELRLLAQNPLRYRRQILALKHFFAKRNCTVLMLDDHTSAKPVIFNCTVSRTGLFRWSRPPTNSVRKDDGCGSLKCAG